MQNKKKNRYFGKGGSLEIALNDAISKVERDAPFQDGTAKWRLIELSGETAGFLSKATYSVVLEMKND